MARQVKVLIVSPHLVQYAAPQFRLMAQHPRLNVQVAYCSLQGVPGLAWTRVLGSGSCGISRSWKGILGFTFQTYRFGRVSGRFLGLINPGLWKLVRSGGFDAVVVFTGYMYASFWITAAATKTNGTAMLFGTDAHELRSRDGESWRARLKEWL